MKKWRDLGLIVWSVIMGLGIFGVFLVMGYEAMRLDVGPPAFVDHAKAAIEDCLE